MKTALEEYVFQDFTVLTLESPTFKELEDLGSRFGFHRLEIEDCLSRRQLSKIEHYPDHLFVILRFPAMIGKEKVVVPAQLSAFLRDDYLVIVHDPRLSSLKNVIAELKGKEGKIKSPSFVLYKIIDRLIDDLFPILENLMDDIEAIEDLVFDEKLVGVREVSTLRRRVSSLRRIVYQLRRTLGDLAVELQMRSKEDLSAYLRDLNDHVEKVWEVLEEAKEVIEIYKDTDFVLSTELTNKILAVLTVIFTATIPATLVASFYGMNVDLPLADLRLPLIGEYSAFAILVGGSLTIAGVMMYFFRKIRWL
ncbi:MAG: magnesium transporter CorA family protein [Aigarchaeota archaeon]|nr:magnesium transporter CorA family protein [Aigarchaeota archaeon]MDW8092296.1 magnesium transporter CorA family protein [Nitrososphaerota archaeon]